jgi:DNA end-binding protein Ku
MPQHAFWKGHLRLSLVTCAVALNPATSEGGRLRFHTLNAKTGNPVRSEYVDAETGAVVDDADQAKAFRQGEGDYVLLEEEELDDVALESTHTIDIDLFTDPESISWIWYDRPHYLAPDDKVGREAFAVIRDAMAASGKVGIARIVLYGRERALLLKPCKPGIIAWTLRYGDEVRAVPETKAAGKPAKEQAKAIESFIQRRLRDWDDDMLADPVQRELQKLIAAKDRQDKGKGKERSKGKPGARPSGGDNVVDIMDALRRSLGGEEPPRRKAS